MTTAAPPLLPTHRPRQRRTHPAAAVPDAPLPAWVDALPLTPAERRVVQFVHSFRSARKVGPAFREAGAALGVSVVTVFQAAHAAARKGALLVDRDKARSARLAAGPDDPAAGRAVRAEASAAAARELAARAAVVMRRYAGLWAGDVRTGPRELAVDLRREMRSLAERISAVLRPAAGGAGKGGAE
jgi:hypothetical protein